MPILRTVDTYLPGVKDHDPHCSYKNDDRAEPAGAQRWGLPAQVDLLEGWIVGVPAPWYLWRGLAGSAEACAQVSPGEGWHQVGGPFVDAACRKRLRVVPL